MPVDHIAELIKTYRIDVAAFPGRRLADFLVLAAENAPKAFIDKRRAAKIAFAQRRLPSEDSEMVRRQLKSAIVSAKRILVTEYGRDLVSDRVEGVRATIDDTDVAETTRRTKHNRVHGAIRSLKITDDLIDTRNLRGEIRREVIRTRTDYKGLFEYLDSMPLLLPKKSGDD